MKNSVNSGVLLLLTLAAGQDTRHLRGRNRGLQGNPCSIPFEDVTITGPDGSVLFRPSYLENCFDSLSMDSFYVIQHIESLRETFRQYYAFYNLANDPAASEPLNFQEELGYTLFSGPLEGQVNLDEEFAALLDKVTDEGASVATFWDLQIILNKLYDGHVALPFFPGDLNTLLGISFYVAIPERLLENNNSSLATFNPNYNDDGEFEFFVTFEGSNITEEIVAINGMAPYEWFFDFVSKPETALGWLYQSIGARMNRAFKTLAPAGPTPGMFALGLARPTAFFPDSFPVTYASGEEEVFHAGVSIFAQDALMIYDLVNSNPTFDTPGATFENFWNLAETVVNVSASTQERVVREIKPPPKYLGPPPLPKSRAGHSKDEMGFEFDEMISLQNPLVGNDEVVAAFSIEDEYAVLKIETFAFLFDRENKFAMVEIWSNFTAAAKAKGVKKAIIDISGNGGGFANSAEALVISMYPFIPYELIEERFDQTYNDVMIFTNATIFPIVEEIVTFVANVTDVELDAVLDTLPESIDTALQMLLASLTSFCCMVPNLMADACLNPSCGPLLELYESVGTLSEFRTGPQLRNVLNLLLQNFETFNAFTTTLGNYLAPDPNSFFEVTRGGQQQGVTNRYEYMTEEEYHEVVARAFQNNFMFDEYVVLSDGAAGSGASIFASQVQQIWANREKLWNYPDDAPPIAALTAVTYGGTKDPADTTLAGFAANVVGVNIGVPIITAGLLYALQLFLPPEEAWLVRNVTESYVDVLPVPPYFADGMPQMPIGNYYDKFMDPGAVPFQYVKIPADKHIQKIFRRNLFAVSDDLGAMYSAAAAVGFSPQPQPVEESQDEVDSFVEKSEKEAPSSDGAMP